MYFETSIAKLSKAQLAKLLRGENVRIKKGSVHKIHLLENQIIGLEKKHRLGKAHTIKFTQDQITKQGSGLMSDIYKFIKRTPVLRKAVNYGIQTGKKHLQKGVNYLSSKAHEGINSIPYIEGEGIGGMALTGGAELAGLIGGPGSDEAKKVLGTLGGVANFLGLGLRGPKKGTKATPKQLEALARGRATRDANRQAKLYNILGKQHSASVLTKRTPTKKQLEALVLARAKRQMLKASTSAKRRSGGALYTP